MGSLHPTIRFVFQSVIDRSEKSMNSMLPLVKLDIETNIIYAKYPKHCPHHLAATMYCGRSKILILWFKSCIVLTFQGF